MYSFTFAAFAPGVSVCGMMSSVSVITSSFWAGLNTFGFQAPAAASGDWRCAACWAPSARRFSTQSGAVAAAAVPVARWRSA